MKSLTDVCPLGGALTPVAALSASIAAGRLSKGNCTSDKINRVHPSVS
jgi:hypothetical protein